MNINLNINLLSLSLKIEDLYMASHPITSYVHLCLFHLPLRVQKHYHKYWIFMCHIREFDPVRTLRTWKLAYIFQIHDPYSRIQIPPSQIPSISTLWPPERCMSTSDLYLPFRNYQLYIHIFNVVIIFSMMILLLM